MSESSFLVGVVVVGHGHTATELMRAAEGILGARDLEGVVAVDAGVGETPRLNAELCEVIERVDEGAGVLVLVDRWGASPCCCAQLQAGEHPTVIVAGLNLAMLLKIATLDRRELGSKALAEACADSGRRAVQVRPEATAKSREEHI